MYQEPVKLREDIRAYSSRLQAIRTFFSDRDILEVVTDPLMKAMVPDPFVAHLLVEGNCGTHYLHTSPEWAMKKLLVSGSGSIYQIAQVFRDDPHSRWHHPSFSMLEWYELGVDDQTLTESLISLLRALGIKEAPTFVNMMALYEGFGVDLEDITVQGLRSYCLRNKIDSEGLLEAGSVSSWLDLIWVNQIEPTFSHGLIIVTHFFPQQAAMAKIVSSPYPHARRFECYYHGLEIANGYWELTDIAELSQRIGQEKQSVDPEDLRGLPECSGISVGLDRLFAKLDGSSQL